MRRVIRLNDPTSHGGKVIIASGRFKMMGIEVARKGDQCTCPKKGHDNCVIVEGDTSWLIDGIPVALEGHKTSCGASLIATLTNLRRDF